MRVFDARTKQKSFKLRGHQDNIRCVHFDSDHTITSSSTDGTIKLWDTRQQKCFKTLHMHKDSVWTFLYDSNNALVSGGKDKSVCYVDTKDMESCNIVQLEHPITSVRILYNNITFVDCCIQ